MEPDKPYWSCDPGDEIAALGTGRQGLSVSEAAARLLRGGANTVEDQPSVTVPKLLLHQFESPLVLILIFGAAISLVLRNGSKPRSSS